MTRAFRLLIVMFLGLLVAACGGITAIDAGKQISVGNGVSVTPQSRWNQFSGSGQVLWTQNGFTLDTLHFITGIKAGKPLYPLANVRKDDQVNFAANMLPNDLQDLVVSTMEKEGLDNVRASSLAPCPFGKGTGFCFDLDFATKDGLAMKGKVIVNKRADSLDIVEFRAPSEYYFGAEIGDVGQVFNSIQVQ